MGYYLQAFLGHRAELELIQKEYSVSMIIDLEQNISIIPLTEELYDQINNYSESDSILIFEYFTINMEEKILEIIGKRKLGYVEAEYFGGEGGQQAIIWNEGRRVLELSYDQDRINAVLKEFGVIADEGKDEFATLGFGRERNTRDWIE